MNQEPGLVHMDIKEQNIVMDLESGRARLIDYGYVRPYDKIVTHTDLRVIFRAYSVWPPEWDVLYHRLVRFYVKRRGLTKEAAMAKFPPKNDTHYSQASILMNSTGYKLPSDDASNVFRLIDRTFETHYPLAKTRSSSELFTQFISEFANKLDIFSTGCVVAWVAGMGAAQLPMELQAPIRRWIHKATDPNPYARYTPEDALADYRHICTELEAAEAANEAEAAVSTAEVGFTTFDAHEADEAHEADDTSDLRLPAGYVLKAPTRYGGTVAKTKQRRSKNKRRTIPKENKDAFTRRKSKSRSQSIAAKRRKSRSRSQSIAAKRRKSKSIVKGESRSRSILKKTRRIRRSKSGTRREYK